MKPLCLGLVMLVGALGAGCSKSSADGSAKQQKAVGSAAPACVDRTAPPAAGGGEKVVATGDPCDDACTNLAICYEKVYEGEDFSQGGACVDSCNEMAAAD